MICGTVMMVFAFCPAPPHLLYFVAVVRVAAHACSAAVLGALDTLSHDLEAMHNMIIREHCMYVWLFKDLQDKFVPCVF